MLDFSKVKLLVIGDIIVDRYLMGKSNRLSPEAPVPVVEIMEEKLSCGGAANVAKNIKSLGAECLLCGVVGEEYNSLFPKSSGIIKSSKLTTVKTRVISGNQQIVRFDIEDRSKVDFSEFVDFLNLNLPSYEYVIISDYAKGVITTELVNYIKTFDVKIIIDPKPDNITHYPFSDTITPNKKEAGEILRKEFNPKDIYKLKDASGTKNTIVTLGRRGALFCGEDYKLYHFPALKSSVFDVTGAGDTFLATYSVARAANWKPFDAVQLANKAAGISVTKFGTEPITLQEL